MSRKYPSLKSPFAWIQTVIQHWKLLVQLAKREVLSKYKGSVLGMLWILVTPMVMLGIYTFVFSVVFSARWGTSSVGKLDFALFVFSGLLFFNFFAECLGRAPTLILENISFVKKVVFPLEILPVVALFVAGFGAAVHLLVLIIMYGFAHGIPPLTALLLPVIFLPLVLFTLGVTWFLASLGVFVRDIKPAVGIIITMIMFLCPIFYPISAVPPRFQTLLLLNPLAIPLEESKKILFMGELPDLQLLGISIAVSYLVCWLGYSWFMLTRKGFADVA